MHLTDKELTSENKKEQLTNMSSNMASPMAPLFVKFNSLIINPIPKMDPFTKMNSEVLKLSEDFMAPFTKMNSEVLKLSEGFMTPFTKMNSEVLKLSEGFKSQLAKTLSDIVLKMTSLGVDTFLKPLKNTDEPLKNSTEAIMPYQHSDTAKEKRAKKVGIKELIFLTAAIIPILLFSVKSYYFIYQYFSQKSRIESINEEYFYENNLKNQFSISYKK